jgi:hypothetical protein
VSARDCGEAHCERDGVCTCIESEPAWVGRRPRRAARSAPTSVARASAAAPLACAVDPRQLPLFSEVDRG